MKTNKSFEYRVVSFPPGLPTRFIPCRNLQQAENFAKENLADNPIIEAKTVIEIDWEIWDIP